MSLDPIQEFLTTRSDALWAFTTQRLRTGNPFTCTILAPAAGVLIDGVLVTERYEGRYFPEMLLDISLPESDPSARSHLIVNGQRVDGNGRHVQLHIEADVTIEVRHG